MVPDVIFYLLKKGCHKEARRITTGEIADEIGVSQQTASRKLIRLEKDGLLSRTGGKIYVTSQAVSEVRKFVNEILNSLTGTSISFAGTVVAGLGEGAYYLSLPGYLAEFKKHLAFKPYPGTLNVLITGEEIEKRLMLRQQKPVVVPGFKKDGRTFGKIECYRCAISGIPCALVFPERSLHGLQVLEVISPVGLRKKLDLKDGSKVHVEVV